MGSLRVEESRKRRVFSDEFKQDAVRLVTTSGYTFAAAAKSLGIGEPSLRQWHAKFAPPPAPCGEDASVAEPQAENQRLRRELRRAEMEREILNKATAYFAKESP
jgi:transposase